MTKKLSKAFIDRDRDLWLTTKEGMHLMGSAEVIFNTWSPVKTLLRRPLSPTGRMNLDQVSAYDITFHFPLEEFTT